VPVFRTAASDTPASGSEPGTPEEPFLPADYRQAPQSRIRATHQPGRYRDPFPVGAPILFVIVFGLFGLLILWGVLELWLRVTAEPGSLVLASGYLSPARERRFPAVEIADVRARIGMQAGGTPYYDLVVVRRDGRTTAAAHGIRDKREAEWLAAALKRALGPD
ncbi:MAG TPA: hypothetical protein VFZ26_01330, partial [Gemmatimonadales bacterium]